MDQALATIRVRANPTFDVFGRRVWSDIERQEILDLVRLKQPYKKIAEEFSCTKNAIVGIVDRARQNGVVVTGKRVVPQREQKPKMRKPAAPRAPRVRLKVIDDSTLVTFEQLTPDMCKHPVGDPRQSDFRFCGKPRLTGLPYCEFHCRRNYQPTRVAIHTKPHYRRG